MVIKIGSEGFEAPQSIPTTGNEVRGSLRVGSNIELLVQEAGADHFSVLPFSIQECTIEEAQREDFTSSSSRKATIARAIEGRMNEFLGMRRAGENVMGDW
jgi:hypothetical protein